MNTITRYFMLIASFIAGLSFLPSFTAPASRSAAPSNNATTFFENCVKSISRQIALFSMKVQFGIDRFFNQPTFAFGLGVSETIDEKIMKTLDRFDERMKKLEEVEKGVAKNADDYNKVTQIVSEVKTQLDTFRKQQIAIKANVRRNGNVSDEAAAHLGAIALVLGVQCGKINSGKSLEIAQSEVKNILGIELKSALTSSDIPLPVQYSGEVAELVYEYGVARRIGTVFPLGTASVKLPKLSSDPTFTLIAASGTVTEKSPQVAFVTLTPEKFGGLVRLPSEIEADSIVPMGNFLGRYAARRMAQVEDYNFFRSTGGATGQNGTAKGLTVSCNASNDNIVYSQGGSTTSGKTKQTDATLADFRNLRSLSGVSGAVLGRAKYAMHPTYESLLVSFNTSATVQPYQRGTNGSPATLDGFEIVWVPDMPALSSSVSASLGHVLFGDFTFNYLGLRAGFAFDTSREAAFATDEILVRALERFTIGKMATDCVAVLLNAAS